MQFSFVLMKKKIYNYTKNVFSYIKNFFVKQINIGYIMAKKYLNLSTITQEGSFYCNVSNIRFVIQYKIWALKISIREVNPRSPRNFIIKKKDGHGKFYF